MLDRQIDTFIWQKNVDAAMNIEAVKQQIDRQLKRYIMLDRQIVTFLWQKNVDAAKNIEAVKQQIDR